MQKILIQKPTIWGQSAVSLFVEIAHEAIKERGTFSVAFSGGGTPLPLYRALGQEPFIKEFPWSKTYFFWGDERDVPLNHPDSNFHSVNEVLLNRVPIPTQNVHRVQTEMGPEKAARAYEEQLKRFFHGEWPFFDLVLLGMGEDGHTASLFPFSDGLTVEDRRFIPNFAPHRKVWRLTLTKNAINAARNTIILVKGAEKASMVANALVGEYNPDEKPIQLIKPESGHLTWLLDENAASLLPAEF